MKLQNKFALGFLTMALFVGNTALAALPEVSYAVNSQDKEMGYTLYDINIDNSIFTQLRIWDIGRGSEYGVFDLNTDREISAKDWAGFTKGLQYLSCVIGMPQTYSGDASVHVPITDVIFLSSKIDNAFASSSTNITKNNGRTEFAEYYCAGGNNLEETLQEGLAKGAATLIVTLTSQGLEWYGDSYPSIPENGKDPDYPGTVVHEFLHALGISATNKNLGMNLGNDGNIYWLIRDSADGNPDKFKAIDEHIYDMNNKSLKELATAAYEVSGNEDNVLFINLVSDTVPIVDSIIFPGEDEDSEPYGAMTPLNFRDGDESRYNGGLYFKGEAVTELLTKNGKVAKIAFFDEDSFTYASASGGELLTMDGITGGIPINTLEPTGFDAGHIELQNCLMSHQYYRNYSILTEGELAVLQDIGVITEEARKNLYGGSLYNSGTQEEKFTYDFTEGYTAAAAWGTGFHVYGSYNQVGITTKDIKADGDYGIGLRIDGVGNDVTISSNISADGNSGNGVAVCYGKEHVLTIAENAVISATGANGTGVRFDFGSNELGDYQEYRGSYIRSKNQLNKARDERLGWESMDSLGALEGALVSEFNIQGTIDALSNNAIYIAENAYVAAINVYDSAAITGDILSNWDYKGLHGIHEGIEYLQHLDETYCTDLNFYSSVDKSFSANIVANYQGMNLHLKATEGACVHNFTFDNENIIKVNHLSLDSNVNLAGNAHVVLNSIDAADSKINLAELTLTGDGSQGLYNVKTLGGYNNELIINTNDLEAFLKDDGDTPISTVGIDTNLQKVTINLTDIEISEKVAASHESVIKLVKDYSLDKVENIKVNTLSGYLFGDTSTELKYENEELKIVAEDRKDNPVNKSLSRLNAAGMFNWRGNMNDLNKRLGELRLAKGNEGVWARISRGQQESDGVTGQSNLYQIGYDGKISDKWILGVALSQIRVRAMAALLNQKTAMLLWEYMQPN